MELAPKYFLKMPTVSAVMCVHDDSGLCLEVSGLLGFSPKILIVIKWKQNFLTLIKYFSFVSCNTERKLEECLMIRRFKVILKVLAF